MTKSPEEYFLEQDFSIKPDSEQQFSPAEQAFMEKYMGLQAGEVLQSIGLSADKYDASTAEPDLHPHMAAEERLEDILKDETSLQMVAFYLGQQEFVIPTLAVQEVIRTLPVAKLPAAPPNVAGVINLRGKVTPLIRLRDILDVRSPRQQEDKFIIICRRHGIQVGMIIERVHTMYRIPQEQIDWNIEARLGINVDFVAGLVNIDESLVGIVSVDKIINSLLA